MTSFYPDELKRIADLCENLDKIDGIDSPWPTMISPIALTGEMGEPWGELKDEVGGAWSWTPPEEDGVSDKPKYRVVDTTSEPKVGDSVTVSRSGKIEDVRKDSDGWKIRVGWSWFRADEIQ